MHLPLTRRTGRSANLLGRQLRRVGENTHSCCREDLRSSVRMQVALPTASPSGGDLFGPAAPHRTDRVTSRCRPLRARVRRLRHAGAHPQEQCTVAAEGRLHQCGSARPRATNGCHALTWNGPVPGPTKDNGRLRALGDRDGGLSSRPGGARRTARRERDRE